ncbi:glycosyltransferase family 4 protein [Melioribacter sp. OK-6-Me]|uniref:glycosyltransferase family 4 protein n=1 Tax=unclassified Melioribacter TaxID=2627329 RepID=UPI003ED930DF
MRVVHFTPYFTYASGTNTYLRNLLIALEKYCTNVTLLTNNRSVLSDITLQNIDTEIIHFETGIRNIFYLPKNLIDLYYKLTSLDVDVIHTHHRYPELISSILKKQCKKTVTTIHSKVDGFKKISFRSDSIIVPCKFLADYLMRNFNINSGRIHVLYNCIEPELYNNPIPVHQIERSMLNIKPDDIVFLYSGRICKEKGIDYLCKVFNEFSKKKKNIKLILMGDIKNRSLLKYSSGSVLFIGYTKHPNAFYKLADVLVHPSYCDVLPYAVLEAGYWGKIVLATDTGGIPEIIKNNENGLVFKAGDASALDKLLRYITDNLEDCRSMGINLQNDIKKITSPDKYVNELMKIYESI